MSRINFVLPNLILDELLELRGKDESSLPPFKSSNCPLVFSVVLAHCRFSPEGRRDRGEKTMYISAFPFIITMYPSSQLSVLAVGYKCTRFHKRPKVLSSAVPHGAGQAIFELEVAPLR